MTSPDSKPPVLSYSRLADWSNGFRVEDSKEGLTITLPPRRGAGSSYFDLPWPPFALLGGFVFLAVVIGIFSGFLAVARGGGIHAYIHVIAVVVLGLIWVVLSRFERRARQRTAIPTVLVLTPQKLIILRKFASVPFAEFSIVERPSFASKDRRLSRASNLYLHSVRFTRPLYVASGIPEQIEWVCQTMNLEIEKRRVASQSQT